MINTPPRLLSILLLDDDAVDVMAVRRALGRTGRQFTIDIAVDGVEALDRLARRAVRPDAMILDLNMPRMNGLEFLAEYRHVHEATRIPIFVLTTGGSEEERDAAYALGITGYFVKAGSDRLSQFAQLLVSFLDLVEPPSANRR